MKIIKCCPFCGSHEIEICRTNPNACWIKCADCGAESESSKTRKQAIQNWNRRYHDDFSSIIIYDQDRES